VYGAEIGPSTSQHNNENSDDHALETPKMEFEELKINLKNLKDDYEY